MRRPLIVTALAGLVLALLTSVAPSASAAEYDVRDMNFTQRTDLREYSYRCGGPSDGARYWRQYGGPAPGAGTASGGYRPVATGSGIGPFAWTSSPGSLTRLSIQSWRTASQPDGRGELLVFLYEEDGGYWTGRATIVNSFDDTWVTWNGLATTLRWYYNGASTASYDATLPSFTADNGGLVGAWIGFTQGCNGESFFFDDFHVGAQVYDFEGPTSTHSHIESWDGGSASGGRDTAAIDGNRTIGYGQQLDLLGHTHFVVNGNANYFVGNGSFYRLDYGSTTWTKVGDSAFTLDYYATQRVQPQRRTIYSYRFAGDPVYPGSGSEVLVVDVRAALPNPRVQDRTLRSGQRVVVKGAVRPATRGMTVRMQRKVGSKWRTVATSKTRRGGKYTLSAKARTGTWKVRVAVASGRGLTGGTSSPIGGIKVKKAKAPRPAKQDVDAGGRGYGPRYVKPAPIRRPVTPPRRSLSTMTHAAAASTTPSLAPPRPGR